MKTMHGPPARVAGVLSNLISIDVNLGRVGSGMSNLGSFNSGAGIGDDCQQARVAWSARLD